MAAHALSAGRQSYDRRTRPRPAGRSALPRNRRLHSQIWIKTMEPFNELLSFYGTQKTYRFEADVYDCEIEGEIPEGLNGSLHRAGPDTQYPTMAGDVIIN